MMFFLAFQTVLQNFTLYELDHSRSVLFCLNYRKLTVAWIISPHSEP